MFTLNSNNTIRDNSICQYPIKYVHNSFDENCCSYLHSTIL